MVEHKVRNAFNNNYYSVYRADEVGDDKPDDVNPDIRLWDIHLAMHADFFIHAFLYFILQILLTLLSFQIAMIFKFLSIYLATLSFNLFSFG